MTPTANGLEALNLLVAGVRPALVLLDMICPVLDGWQFLSQLDADLPDVGLPVVIVTGLSIACDEWAISLGASGLLRKPINLEDLLAKVQQHISLAS